MPSISNTKNIRVLSFDGGGTRGYAQLCFLERFLTQTGVSKLTDIFDAFVGSSVGALIATALAVGVTVTELKTIFREQTPWIFTIRSALDIGDDASEPSNKPNWIQKIAMLLASDPFYKSVSEHSNYGDARLRQVVTSIVGDRKLSEIPFPVFITGVDYTKKKPVLFSTIPCPTIPSDYLDLLAKDVIIGSASAPVYFPSTLLHLEPDPELQPNEVIDGGIFQNNPTALGVSALLQANPDKHRACVLSLGAGREMTFPDQTSTPTERVVTKLLSLLGLAMNSSEDAIDITQRGISRMAPNYHYYRFNIDLDPERDTELDTSTADFFDYLELEVNRKYTADYSEISMFINRLLDLEAM